MADASIFPYIAEQIGKDAQLLLAAAAVNEMLAAKIKMLAAKIKILAAKNETVAAKNQTPAVVG